ncbi:MAG: VanZ family protein [candidate division WOR-3 bacterium]|nr:VanZ family protein [candidate division WOR-3 bacterium]
MSLSFGLISTVYIALIFLLAGLPGGLRLISRFNPLSLLHIPLYGLLTFFLIRTFLPKRGDPLIRSFRLTLAFTTFLALLVAVLDELHQVHIPGREASGWDVGLDAAGIFLAMLLYTRLKK